MARGLVSKSRASPAVFTHSPPAARYRFVEQPWSRTRTSQSNPNATKQKGGVHLPDAKNTQLHNPPRKTIKLPALRRYDGENDNFFVGGRRRSQRGVDRACVRAAFCALRNSKGQQRRGGHCLSHPHRRVF